MTEPVESITGEDYELRAQDPAVHYIAGKGHNVVCKYCHTGGFRWYETRYGWRLFDEKKQMHNCPKYRRPLEDGGFRPRKVVRREEVQRIRAEGAQAYRDGKHKEQNPHQHMNAFQWLRGYMEAEQEDENGNKN